MAFFPKDDAFVLQHRSLLVGTRSFARGADCTLRIDHPVPGNTAARRQPVQGPTAGAGCARVPDVGGDLAVGCHLACGDRAYNTVDLPKEVTRHDAPLDTGPWLARVDGIRERCRGWVCRNRCYATISSNCPRLRIL